MPNFDEQIKNYFQSNCQRTELRNVFNTASSYLGFCSDSYEDLSEDSDCGLVQLTPYTENIKSAQGILYELKLLDKEKDTSKFLTNAENFLAKMFIARFNYIYRRAQKNLETRKQIAKGEKLSNYFIPTKPGSIEGFSAQDKILSRHMIDRYQFTNQIIHDLYKLFDPKKLKDHTKQYISCSRTLWPVLNDETLDLSYPDFAILTYDDDPDELKNHKDYDYYVQAFKENISIKKLHGRLIYPYAQFPTYLERPSFLYGEENNKKTEKNVASSTSASNHSQKKKSRNKKRKNNKKATSVTVSNTNNNNLKQPVIETSVHQDIILDTTHSNSSYSNISEKDNVKSQEISDIKIEDNTSTASPIDINVSVNELNDMTSQDLLENIEALEEKPKFEKSARGNRLFHAQAPIQNTISPLKISNGHQHIIDTIFDYKMKGQGFSFKDFESVVEALGGQVLPSRSGGSHRRVIDQEGKVIGGTYAHGRNQIYSVRTVSYLRDILRQLNAEPSL